MQVASTHSAAKPESRRYRASPLPNMLSGAAKRRTVWNGLHWAIAGNVVYALSQYFMLVVLAQVGTPHHLGQYALALAIAGPVMFFCNLQLRAILASDAGRMHCFRDYWRLRILTAPIAWAAIAGIAILGRFNIETAIVIIAAGTAKSLESLSDLCYGSIQRDTRLDLVGKSLAIKGPISLVLLGAVTWATDSVAFGMAGVGIAWLALLLIYDLPNVRRTDAMSARRWITTNSLPWKSYGQLCAIGLPLGTSVALLSLIVALPHVLVERYMGEQDVGIYAALSSLAWAGIPLINAFGQAAMPVLGELYVTKDFRRLQTFVVCLAATGCGLGIAGMIGGWLFGERLISIFYGSEYSGRTELLMWLMAAASLLFSSRFVADSLTAMRHTRIQLVAQVVGAVIILGAGVQMLPDCGLVGVAQILTAALAIRALLLISYFLFQLRTLRSGATLG